MPKISQYFNNEDFNNEESNERCCKNEQIYVTKSGSTVEQDNSEYLDPEQPQPGTSKTESESFFDVEKM